ncbi:M14 family metallopeptidase [Solirubrobacter ginsenosidimutans]|uniref:Zinc carboxypeptidase n=1 Tax=Solirubrobacter ginsenosidimutans TaxID=490573 RepID=A0A9X3N0J6_9ACTN|nr:M14 family zinc carboxypeptidase [Solirubrobacter ginsenosidimutans]MDA0164587.1 M14 family metallopeptidase [Solirubrobacter ginsenosidimutans]
MQFKLPSKATMEQLESQGTDFDHGFIDAPGGGILASAVVTDEEKALLEAQGYAAVKVLQTQADVDALRASRDATIAEEAAAKSALTSSAAEKSKQAIAGTVRAQRADYWEDVSGRYLSIEGTTTEAAITGGSYTGPALQAAWFAADGTQLGSGQLSAILDPDVSPAAYLYHGSRFRIGNVGDGGMPAYVRIAAPNGDVATLDAKKWLGNGGTTSPGGFIQDFNTHYVTPRESYAKMRELTGEFTNITTLMNLPYKTNGYQRKAQTIIGQAAAYAGATSVPAADQPRSVVLTSLAWGQEGGNNLSAAIVNDGASKDLLVTVSGNAITVHAATDAAGVITSTAAQVVAAINANTDAAKLVTAALYRTNTGAAPVLATPSANLSDWLKAPTSQPRGPIQVQGMRIGNNVGKPQDQKVGVFIYCQEHAREWGTPLVCLETAERLVRNYGVDPETTKLIDGLDIYVIPSINADGATYSMFDNSGQRRNMVNYCASNPTGNNDPAARNSWGVDLNRNFSVGSFFDGYVGASASCTSDTFAGPFELSEPEVRNETFIQTTHPNIKFAMNVHSSGGYFMWPPGAYKADRTTLPYPPYGTLNYFDQTASSVLERIYSYRKTAILPAQTGPVTDVLYSAAGNSADEAYYNHGIIGYDFEIGATKRLADGTTASPGFQPPFGAVPIGGNANLANEGHDEGMEFSNGNYALLQSALDYSNDTTAPSSAATGATLSNAPVGVKFTTSEAASIYYTTDGSTPTAASTEWKPRRPRELPDPVALNSNTTLKWIAVDFKGNTSAVQSKAYVVDLVKPTVTFTNPALDGAVFTQGRPVPLTFTCADENSGVASCTGNPALGTNLNTSTPGTFTYSVTAKDNAGNENVVTRSYTVIDATNADGTINGSVPATLSLVLGSPATFGAFTPGLGKDYTASTTATVTSSAGNATLSIADPSADHTGHLVNGTFFLQQAMQAKATNSATTNTTFADVGSSAAPLNLLSYSAPVSADPVTLNFKQTIAASEGLRTGSYGKTLTFTLSTTTP